MTTVTNDLINTSAPKGGGGKPRETPPEGKYKAAIVAVIDLGTHAESYKGEAPSNKRKVYVVWELLGKAKQTDGSPFIMAETYTFSTHEKAGWRAIWEAHLGTIKQESDIVGQPASRLLGTACRMKIVHKDNGEAGEARRVYANIAANGITELDDEVGERQKTVNVPFLWAIASPEPYRDHDWVPYVFCRTLGKRVPVSEMIARCQEKRKTKDAADADPFPDDDDSETA